MLKPAIYVDEKMLPVENPGAHEVWVSWNSPTVKKLYYFNDRFMKFRGSLNG